ncbi:MAG: hypothetical protein ACXVLQ_18375 [Bacteriovorax sp.]
MEFIGPIITAIVAGIISSTKETASQAVKDAYAGFKSFISSRVENVSFSNIENNPNSEDARTGVVKELEENSKIPDLKAICEEAKKLLQEINQKDKETLTLLDITIEGAEIGGSFNWDGGKAGIENRNLTIKNTKILQNLTIGNNN